MTSYAPADVTRLRHFTMLAGLMMLAGSPVGQAEPPAIEWASVTLQPDTAEATHVQWDILLAIPICGQPDIGGSLRVRFVPPMSLPGSIPADSVWFDGRPAGLSVAGDTLRVSPDFSALPAFCLHDRPFRFSLVFLPEAGFSNPAEPGTYLVEIATDDNPAALSVPVQVSAPDAEPERGG